MKLRRSEVAELYAGINEALAEKDPKIKFDLQMKLIPNKHRLKPIVEEIQEQQEAANKTLQDLRLLHCSKKADDEGKEAPVIIDGRYAGLARGQCPEFDSESDAVLNELKAYMKEEIEIDVVALKESDLPRSVRGLVTEQLMLLVKQATD